MTPTDTVKPQRPRSSIPPWAVTQSSARPACLPALSPGRAQPIPRYKYPPPHPSFFLLLFSFLSTKRLDKRMNVRLSGPVLRYAAAAVVYWKCGLSWAAFGWSQRDVVGYQILF